MATFIPGLELAQAFYQEVLAAIIGPIPHAAALLGEGSEVLGFDTARSTDHAWGPRAQLFVEPAVVLGIPSVLRSQGVPELLQHAGQRCSRSRVRQLSSSISCDTRS